MAYMTILSSICACIASSLLFFSCAHSKNITDSEYCFKPQKVNITKTRKFSLLPASYIEGELSSFQYLTVKVRGNTFSSPVYIQADKTSLYLSMMNTFGVSIGELTYRDNSITFDSAVLDRRIKAEYLIADVQFCYYDVSLLSSELQKSNLKLTVETKDAGNIEIRRIYNGMGRRAKCVEQITKTAGNILIENFYYGYSCELQEANE